MNRKFGAEYRENVEHLIPPMWVEEWVNLGSRSLGGHRRPGPHACLRPRRHAAPPLIQAASAFWARFQLLFRLRQPNRPAGRVQTPLEGTGCATLDPRSFRAPQALLRSRCPRHPDLDRDLDVRVTRPSCR